MTDLASLPPEELDRLACEAVGLEPWHTEYRAARVGSGAPHVFAADEWWSRCEQKLWAEVETLHRWHMVSTQPAACAVLKAAFLEMGDCQSIEIHLSNRFERYVRVRLNAGPWIHEERNTGKTEERAVALAVVAWAQAKGE